MSNQLQDIMEQTLGHLIIIQPMHILSELI